MRNPARTDALLNHLNQLWKHCPDLRFWQLILLLVPPEGKEGTDLFFWEEDVWHASIDATMEKYGWKD